MSQKGLNVVTLTEPSGDHMFNFLKPEAIRGIITIGSISTQVLLDIGQLEIPVVMVDHSDPAYQCDTVFADTFECMRELTTKLVSKGYRSFQFVGNISDAPSFYERWLAFRSTLEEVVDADVLLHVVDGSHPHPEEQVRAVRSVLSELESVPETELLVVNKVDAVDDEVLLRLKRLWPDAVFVSARTAEGLDTLRHTIDQLLPRPAVELELLVPYDRGDVIARLHERGEVLETEHTATGTRLRVRVSEHAAARLAPFVATPVS